MGFEPQVNQRLLPPTFPRYTQLRSRTDAINNLIQLMDRLKAMCKIKDHTNFHSALVIIFQTLFSNRSFQHSYSLFRIFSITSADSGHHLACCPGHCYSFSISRYATEYLVSNPWQKFFKKQPGYSSHHLHWLAAWVWLLVLSSTIRFKSVSTSCSNNVFDRWAPWFKLLAII